LHTDRFNQEVKKSHWCHSHTTTHFSISIETTPRLQTKSIAFYTKMSEIDYQGSSYIPPRVAVVVGALLRGPRDVGHSVQFSDFFSSVREERKAYVDGLSAVPVIFFSIFLAWFFIAILLKCKGAEVGCASGQAFVSLRSDDENSEMDEGKPDDDIASTSDSSDASELSDKPLFLGPGGEMMEHSDSDFNNNDHFGMKFLRCMRRKKEEDGTDDTINLLERRTRISFLGFATIALLCTPLNLFLTFGPLREVAMEASTTESPDGLLLKIQNILDEVETSMTTIESLSLDAVELINTVSTDVTVVCPLVNSTDFQSIIGVDINDIMETIIQQQLNLEDDIAAQLSTKQSFVDGIEDQLSVIETYADESMKYLWILPGLLLTIIGLTMTSIVGVILAWQKKSSSRFQRMLSYGVFPLLVLVAIICWIVVMIFSLSTMVGADICLSGSSNESPDQTILDILSVVGNGTEGASQFASYVNNCDGSDPTQDISDIKLETQGHIDNIWRQISKIDSVGRAVAIEKCGTNGEFLEMLSGARELAMILTGIRRTLSSLEELIGCSSIHPIYIEAAHDILCTQTLSASGYGFITFLIMWVCVMAMISLRASWLRSTEEDKIYHDETDVAENMVVDEHEEYLAYISRYKHEWQEYEGIEEDSSPRSSEFHGSQHTNPEDHDQQYYYGDDEDDYGDDQVSKSDQSTLGSASLYTENESQPTQPPEEPPIIYQRQLTTHELMDHHEDGLTRASSEISFASLSSELKTDVLNLGNLLTMPPPTNPEFSNEEEDDDDDDEEEQRLPDPDGAYDDRTHESDPDGFAPDFDNNFSQHVYADVVKEEVEVGIQEVYSL